jgi:micrococcal nuclease
MRRIALVLVLVVAAYAAGRSGAFSRLPGLGDGGGTAQGGRHADRVARVVDGDTVHLARLGRARLIGIDTPEVYGGVECFGRRASAFAKRLLPPGTAVTWTRDAEARDRYGRALIYLVRRDGVFVNAELARQGYATQLTIPPNVRHARTFRRLVREARDHDRGLWHACG